MPNSVPPNSATPLPLAISDPEAVLRVILESSPAGIFLLRPLLPSENGEPADFSIVFVNPEGQRMLRIQEQPQDSLLSLFPHAGLLGVLGFYQQVYKTGAAGKFEVHYQQDGLDDYFHLSAQLSGSLLVVSFTDTDHHKQSAAEQALRESQLRERAARAEADLQREQLYNIFMEAPAMICIFEGPSHTFKLVNPRYQQLVGERPLLGKPIAEAMPELAGQPIYRLLDEVYRTGKSFFAHEMLVQLDNDNSGGDLDENYYNFIYQATHNLNGDVDGILVFAYEVTAQVKARRQVEYSHQEVQALNEELAVRNAELLRTQEALKLLNQELEAHVDQRTKALQLAQAETVRQQQQLERLFMQAPAAICILNGPELVYELVNPAYQQLFPNRQLLGKPILEALPELETNVVYRTFQEVYETGITHEEHALLIPLARPEDGMLENRYFNFIQQARISENGGIDGVLVFAFEVTEQVEAQQAIEASARQLQLITDSLPVLIGYLDKEEKYRFANKAYETWFNQDPRKLLGRPVREIVGETAYAGVKTYIERALAGERLDFKAKMPYRKDFTKHIRTSYVPDVQDGNVNGFYTLVSDITEQVEAQQAVEESVRQAKALARDLATANYELLITNQQLTRTNIDLDNFIYTASHDLKGPILNIEGLMEALLEVLPPEVLESHSTKRITQLILHSVQRFKRTLEHLTEITKLQKEHTPNASLVDMGKLIADIELDLAPAIQAAGAQVEVDVTACPYIRFSKKNMRSVIYNLIANAIKYQAPDRSPFVQVLCQETPEYQILSVSDNGLGIESKHQDKLFVMFKRLHNHVEGSGVGLYMVKRIVENAGGKIEVESTVGKGSVFRVYFRRES